MPTGRCLPFHLRLSSTERWPLYALQYLNKSSYDVSKHFIGSVRGCTTTEQHAWVRGVALGRDDKNELTTRTRADDTQRLPAALFADALVFD